MKTNFEQARMELLERRNILLENMDEEKHLDLTAFKSEFKSLFEGIIFDLISTPDNGDSFYGNIMVRLGRKFNYCLATPINHQVVNMNVILHVNPFLLIDYNKEEMKELLRHEIYHIIGQHAKRSEPFVGSVDNRIIVLACDLVANKLGNINSKGFWTYRVLREKFGIQLEEDNTIEKNIKELSLAMKENSLFLDALDLDIELPSIEDDEEIDEDELEDFLTNLYESYIDEDEEGLCSMALHDFFLESSKVSDLSLMDDFIRKVVVESSSDSRGLMPAGLKALLDELNAPAKISWQKILMKRLGSVPVPYKKTIVRNDRRMPNRLDLRGRISDRVPKLYVAIDTSGSVSDEEIKYILNEIEAIGKAYKANVVVIECDAEVQRVYNLREGAKPKKDIEGRGGTAFTPVFNFLKDDERVSKDAICIYFTDGGGEYEIPKVPCQTLWVLTRESDLSVKNPQGRILSLQEDVRFENYKKGFLV